MAHAEDSDVCPLCLEALDITDLACQFCTCGYSMCLWCWHRIREDATKQSIPARCPNCRTVYRQDRVKMDAIDPDQLEDTRRKQKEERKKAAAAQPKQRRDLANVRVVQRNLVYAVGLAMEICYEETLMGPAYFGAFGQKMVKQMSVNRSGPYGSAVARNGPTGSAYITFKRPEDAKKCIEVVNGAVWGGKQVKACFGTTKYCNAFLKGIVCNNPDCLYLHEIAEETDSYTKEETKSSKFINLTHAASMPRQSSQSNIMGSSLSPGLSSNGKQQHSPDAVPLAHALDSKGSIAADAYLDPGGSPWTGSPPGSSWVARAASTSANASLPSPVPLPPAADGQEWPELGGNPSTSSTLTPASTPPDPPLQAADTPTSSPPTAQPTPSPPVSAAKPGTHRSPAARRTPTHSRRSSGQLSNAASAGPSADPSPSATSQPQASSSNLSGSGQRLSAPDQAPGPGGAGQADAHSLQQPQPQYHPHPQPQLQQHQPQPHSHQPLQQQQQHLLQQQSQQPQLQASSLGNIQADPVVQMLPHRSSGRGPPPGFAGSAVTPPLGAPVPSPMGPHPSGPPGQLPAPVEAPRRKGPPPGFGPPQSHANGRAGNVNHSSYSSSDSSAALDQSWQSPAAPQPQLQSWFSQLPGPQAPPTGSSPPHSNSHHSMLGSNPTQAHTSADFQTSAFAMPSLGSGLHSLWSHSSSGNDQGSQAAEHSLFSDKPSPHQQGLPQSQFRQQSRFHFAQDLAPGGCLAGGGPNSSPFASPQGGYHQQQQPQLPLRQDGGPALSPFASQQMTPQHALPARSSSGPGQALLSQLQMPRSLSAAQQAQAGSPGGPEGWGLHPSLASMPFFDPAVLNATAASYPGPGGGHAAVSSAPFSAHPQQGQPAAAQAVHGKAANAQPASEADQAAVPTAPNAEPQPESKNGRRRRGGRGNKGGGAHRSPQSKGKARGQAGGNSTSDMATLQQHINHARSQQAISGAHLAQAEQKFQNIRI